jgi:hypothetical protein
MSTLVIKDLANSNLTLLKINQDAYSGEYFKRVSNTEYRVKVRHTTEKVTTSSPRPMARHNVELTVTVFQTDGTPPLVRQAYYILRQPQSGDDTVFTNFSKNLQNLVSDANIGALIGWDTDLVSA